MPEELTESATATAEDASTPGESAPELSEQEKLMAKLKEAVGVTKELVGPLRYRMSVSVPRPLIDERMVEQLKEVQRDSVIPGFRRGKAPMTLVEKRFAPEIGEQLVNLFVGSSFMAATEKEGLDALGDPLILLPVEEERVDESGVTRKSQVDKLLKVDEALDRIKIPKEGPFEYTCEVEVRPEFTIPELDNIPVSIPKAKTGDTDVDAAIRRLLMREGTFEPVETGGIELDDLVYGDVKLRVGDDVIETLTNFDLPARATMLKGIPLPNMGDALKGKQRDQTVTVEGTIPEDHERTDHRGKTAAFDITIREIKRLRVPELTDDQAKTWGFETASEVRDMVRRRLESEAEEERQTARRQQVERYLIDKVAMDLPEALSHRQTERVLARRMIELYRMGIPEVEIQRRIDQLRLKAHDQAIHDLKLSFIMEKIAKEREVEITEEEINGAIADIAARQGRRFDRVRDDLSRDDGLFVLATHLRDRKIADLLLEKAQITEASE